MRKEIILASAVIAVLASTSCGASADSSKTEAASTTSSIEVSPTSAKVQSYSLVVEVNKKYTASQLLDKLAKDDKSFSLEDIKKADKDGETSSVDGNSNDTVAFKDKSSSKSYKQLNKGVSEVVVVNGKTEVKIEVTAKDTTAPVISGAKDISVYVGDKVSYTKGVSVKDNYDSKVKLSVNSEKVNTSKAGTYSVEYTAKDTSGNKATKKVKVKVSSRLTATSGTRYVSADSIPVYSDYKCTKQIGTVYRGSKVSLKSKVNGVRGVFKVVADNGVKGYVKSSGLTSDKSTVTTQTQPQQTQAVVTQSQQPAQTAKPVQTAKPATTTTKKATTTTKKATTTQAPKTSTNKKPTTTTTKKDSSNTSDSEYIRGDSTEVTSWKCDDGYIKGYGDPLGDGFNYWYVIRPDGTILVK